MSSLEEIKSKLEEKGFHDLTKLLGSEEEAYKAKLTLDSMKLKWNEFYTWIKRRQAVRILSKSEAKISKDTIYPDTESINKIYEKFRTDVDRCYRSLLTKFQAFYGKGFEIE